MATEIIYVSLALVLLARIYVAISPPEFLEEHKDRRYHEYHIYRQYHLHKQYDKNDQANQGSDTELDQDSSTLSDPTTTRTPAIDHLPSKSSLNGFHQSSDDLVLIGIGQKGRSQSFPLHDFVVSPLSKLNPSLASSSSTLPPKETGDDIWKHIISTSESAPVSNYISLDISEIYYNGSLDKFAQDPEVVESIREIRSGQRDSTKAWPAMTVVWEDGRWCCLEGRILYTLRTLEWEGQVRVQVLVDKDPAMLAVTEECWRAAGMTMDSPLFNRRGYSLPTKLPSAKSSAHSGPTKPLEPLPLTPLSPLLFPPLSPVLSPVSETFDLSPSTVPSPMYKTIPSLDQERVLSKSEVSTIQTADTDTLTLSNLLIAEESLNSAEVAHMNHKVRFSLSAAEGHSLPGSPTGNEADDEDEDDEDEDDEDEDLDDEDDDGHEGHALCEETRIGLGLSYGSLDGQSTLRRRQHFHQRIQERLRAEDEDETGSDLTLVTPSSPTLPATNLAPPSSIKLKPTSGLSSSSRSGRQNVSWASVHTVFEDESSFVSCVVTGSRTGTQNRVGRTAPVHPQQDQDTTAHLKHERRISIPLFALPPPLENEPSYLILEPTRVDPPRRDSGLGDSC